jgi:hypothetical protein
LKRWTAVVRGAVISGIEKSTAVTSLSGMSACNRSYGVSISRPFLEVEHNVLDKCYDSVSSSFLATQQMMWLIKKGDLILSSEPREVRGFFTINFTEARYMTGTVPVYAYDDEDTPDRLSNSEDGSCFSLVTILMPSAINII